MRVELMKDILGDNDTIAEDNRRLFDSHRILAVDFLGSPGSGKTSILEQLIRSVNDLSIKVIEGDVATANDGRRIEEAGAEAFQINTGGACHLDAPMVQRAVSQMDITNTDLLLIENVGNLVCPAAFNLGAHLRVIVSSLPEGDDKPEKYPVAFRGCQGVILNKTDLLDYLDFDIDRFWELCTQLQPEAPHFPTSCVSGAGIPRLCEWLRQQLSAVTAAQ